MKMGGLVEIQKIVISFWIKLYELTLLLYIGKVIGA